MNSPVVLTGNSFLRFFILLVFFFLCEFGEAKLYFCKSVSMQGYSFVSFLGGYSLLLVWGFGSLLSLSSA